MDYNLILFPDTETSQIVNYSTVPLPFSYVINIITADALVTWWPCQELSLYVHYLFPFSPILACNSFECYEFDKFIFQFASAKPKLSQEQPGIFHKEQFRSMHITRFHFAPIWTTFNLFCKQSLSILIPCYQHIHLKKLWMPQGELISVADSKTLSFSR